MALRVEALKDELIDKVVGTVRGKLSGAKATQAEAFVRHFYAHVNPDDIIGQDADDLYGAALSLWTFGQTRLPGEAKVRVFNPRVDQHGWHSPHTIVEIVQDDMPFLVDSVSMELNRRGLAVHQVIHPLFANNRDAQGKLTRLSSRADRADGAGDESFMHVEVDEQPAGKALEDIREGLERVLADVRAAVEDWPAMRAHIRADIERLKTEPPALAQEDIDEAVAFLEWLHDDRFTFLGFREVAFEGSGKRARMEMVDGSGLGVLRNLDVTVFAGLRELGQQPTDIQSFVRARRTLMLAKSNERATVHRRVYMDAVGVNQFDSAGKVVGQRLYLGLYTSAAYSQTPAAIPLIRRKATEVVARSGYDPRSHDGKALAHVLEDFPRDELFQIDVDTLGEIANGIVRLQERQRTALFLRIDPFERFVSAFVFAPRERINARLREAYGEILATALNGTVRAAYTQVGDEPLGRLHYIVRTVPGAIPPYDRKEIEARLVDTGRSWEDRLKQALIEAHGEARGNARYVRYCAGFQTVYKETYNAQTAVFDIVRCEAAVAAGGLAMNLYRPLEAEDNELAFKIYKAGAPLLLSDILPMLENMGLKVRSEVPFRIEPCDGTDRVYMHDFSLVTEDGSPVAFAESRDAFHDSFARVWSGDMEDDGFNRLVLRAGLDWREVVILRAYYKYLRQLGIPFSQDYVQETLARNAAIAQLLVRLFVTRFDPDLEGDRAVAEATLSAQIAQRLDGVANLDEDRILRQYFGLVGATIRTSYFQRAADGGEKPYVAFKFDAQRVEEAPQPRPLREIWVYSPRFEAVHLRFGLVARGGLRWSDRREDFRTEILGLVKAQQVKNAVIVPVGSKGGFVLKKAPPPSDREAFLEEGIACYRLFIGGMLDITDNLVGGAVVPPDRVLRKDDDDPYLVVAADKGTATFSDIANAVAVDHGFWLGDAFASGGSAGYDHKKMAITARGAWESVKRHFREIGHDIQAASFTTVGVGDMSGDVFGNGMLLSEHTQLVGAFNHLHIFVDPDPDPSRSFAERKRLFDLPRSSWADYDPALISQGGGVFERSAKSIPVSPEMQMMFGIKKETVRPNELMSAMLRAEVDLLWFGGIGTYVKASSESHADVGDRANDPVRVNGAELRARVVGEGANLGVTQRGRIEYARAGGRLNTDFIDNSAGVDCSDHEVNIKILLGAVVVSGDMTEKQRNDLLFAMTEEVGELCLKDNYAQSQAISLTEARAPALLDDHRRLMRTMERAGILIRQIEFLPDDEALDNLEAAKSGLTRPEIAVLLAYAKNATYAELLASDLPEDALLTNDLERYFPRALQSRYAGVIAQHQLRREIVATALTNSMINRTGPTFVNEMRNATGRSAPEIARAYMVVREAFGLRDLWKSVEALDNRVPAALQVAMLNETGRTVDRVTMWLLRNAAQPLETARLLEEFAPGIAALKDHLDEILQPDQRADVEARTQRFAHESAPAEIPGQIGRLKVLSSACDIIRLAEASGHPVLEAGLTYFAVGSRFRLDWLRRGANGLAPENSWHRLALGAIIDDLWSTQSALSRQILTGGAAGDDAIRGWLAPRRDSVGRVEDLLAEIESAGQVDLAMLAVANRELRGLAAG